VSDTRYLGCLIVEDLSVVISRASALRIAGFFLGLAAVGIGSETVRAAEPKPSDEWKIDLKLYLWGAGIDATTVGGNELSVSIGDIAENLDFAFMGSFGGHKGRWSALADFIYMNVGMQKNTTGNLLGQPANASVAVDLRGRVINFIGGYTAVQTDKLNFDVVFGARYLGLNTDLGFAIGNQSMSFSGSGDLWDGIIGVKGNVDVSEKWYFSYYLDAGGGDTDFTWQAQAGFGYELPRLDIVFGYRYLDWNFAASDPGGRVFDDLTFAGPHAGVKFVF
jgi:hypothetical protein